ncbi:MAG: anti-sigma factor family protein [Gaiellaceae bacterium]
MRLSDELSCLELVTLVTEYFEDALDPTDVQRFEEHVVFCDGCANYLEQMRATITATGKLREEDLPPALAAGLLDAFRSWKRT